jgi:cytochrome c oxidase subunit 2
MAREETYVGAEPSMTGGRGTRAHVWQLVAIGAVASALGIALGLLIDWFPTRASEQGNPIDTLWDVLLITSVPIFVLVVTVVLYCVWRFRMRPGEELEDGPPIHGNTRLEIIWTALPAILLVALCSYAYVVLTDIEDADASALNVRVVGEQFTWTFYYRAGGREVASPQLYVPRGQQVRFTVQSKDVIHDFWVPAFRMKIDAVPGVDTELRVTPTRVGQYPVVCAELCGLGHAAMRQTAHVVERPEFDRWLRDRAAGRQADLHDDGLRQLPQAGRRGHERRHRTGPRREPEGPRRGVHPREHRGTGQGGHSGLPAGPDAADLRRHAAAGRAGRARQVPCRGDEVMARR